MNTGCDRLLDLILRFVRKGTLRKPDQTQLNMCFKKITNRYHHWRKHNMIAFAHREGVVNDSHKERGRAEGLKFFSSFILLYFTIQPNRRQLSTYCMSWLIYKKKKKKKGRLSYRETCNSLIHTIWLYRKLQKTPDKVDNDSSTKWQIVTWWCEWIRCVQ